MPPSLGQPGTVKKRPRPTVEIPSLGERTFLGFSVFSPIFSLCWMSRRTAYVYTFDFVEPASSTVSAVWNPSHDSSQLSSTPEGHRIDNHAYRRPTHAENGSLISVSGNNHIPIVAAEVCWLSSSPLKASRSKITDEMEDCKSASVWSVSPGYANQITTHQCNDVVPLPIDGNKSGTFVSCRIFGFDLKSSSTGVTPPEMAPSKQANVTRDNAEVDVPSALSTIDSEEKSGLSKDSKEKLQGQLQVSLKEVQSKQSSSTRSRTKVYYYWIKDGFFSSNTMI